MTASAASSCSSTWHRPCPVRAWRCCAMTGGTCPAADVSYRLRVEDLPAPGRAGARDRAGGHRAVGFSQGAGIALLAAAADPGLAFLVLVSSGTVRPARQMRYETARRLCNAGLGHNDQAGL